MIQFYKMIEKLKIFLSVYEDFIFWILSTLSDSLRKFNANLVEKVFAEYPNIF